MRIAAKPISCLFILMVCLAQIGCTKKNNNTENTIRIGEVGSFTGSEATFGKETHQGIELAFAEINKNGGLLGKQVTISKYDNQGKDDETVVAMNRLINEDKVIAILGEVASGRSKVMAPIAQANKIPMVSPSSTNIQVTQIGDYIFRVCFIDPFQGKVMSKFAKENLKAKRVAILRDVKNSYSGGLANAFVEHWKSTGGQIVGDVSYSAGDIDFKAQLTTIRSQKPDAIFVPGYYTDVGLIARQARELGIKAPLLGGDGWDSPDLFNVGGKAINDSYISNHYSSEDPSPRVQEFVKKYKGAFGVVPGGLAAMGYDAALVLAEAIRTAGSEDPKKIRDALAGIKNFQAVTGMISIDENRNAVKPAVVLKIEDGKFKYVTTIKD